MNRDVERKERKKRATVLYACTVLRDDAREIATSPEFARELGTDVGQDWLDLAADLATLTSHSIGKYVEVLDPETRSVLENVYRARGGVP